MADLSLVFDLLGRDRASKPVEDVADAIDDTARKARAAADDTRSLSINVDGLTGSAGKLSGILGMSAGAFAGLGAAGAGVFAGVAAGAAGAVAGVALMGVGIAATNDKVQGSFTDLGHHVAGTMNTA